MNSVTASNKKIKISVSLDTIAVIQLALFRRRDYVAKAENDCRVMGLQDLADDWAKELVDVLAAIEEFKAAL